MLIGCARVSTDEQDTAVQRQALHAAGCERIFEERASGGRWNRPQLQKLPEQLREGDGLVVWKMDRLSRSLKDLLHLMERVAAAGAGFRSLTEAVDTTTPAGRMMMQMVGAFAEFEREMIREWTRAVLAAARADGRIGGRPRKLSARQRQEARERVTSGRKTTAETARLFGVHPSTICRPLPPLLSSAFLCIPTRRPTGVGAGSGRSFLREGRFDVACLVQDADDLDASPDVSGSGAEEHEVGILEDDPAPDLRAQVRAVPANPGIRPRPSARLADRCHDPSCCLRVPLPERVVVRDLGQIQLSSSGEAIGFQGADSS
jgi:DNA invertase Pin-like site-specific DNA recombinase